MTDRPVTTRAPVKQWWAPLWRGLVVDAEAKHYRALGSSVWLFLYLVVHADRKTGVLRRKQTTIARDMSVPERTVRGWFRRILAHGYIETRATGRASTIQVTKWRCPSAMRHAVGDLTGQLWPGRTATIGQDAGGAARKAPEMMRRIERSANPNKNHSTRFLLQQRIGAARPELDNTGCQTREDLLATDLAHGLGDDRNLGLYLQYARQYRESLLRQVLSEVRAVPDTRIKRSRAAFFTYLLGHYADKRNADSRD